MEPKDGAPLVSGADTRQVKRRAAAAVNGSAPPTLLLLPPVTPLEHPAEPRGRFAPSPSGDLHLGGLRTALLAWLHMRKVGGSFALRIEDLDRERCKPEHLAAQLASLRAIGLDWDEGPDRGGPFGPYVQSERLALYEAALEKLRATGLAYPCYCSRAEVARAATAPHGAGDDGPRYPGTCRKLTAEQRASKERAGRKPSWRFRVREGTVSFDDGVFGPLSQAVLAEVGDFVIRRADGVFAYQLAVVVDDIAMRMTDVLRGADLVHSTPRQLLLYEALGAPPPRFHHVEILLGPDGDKLSKRHGPVGVGALLAAGVTPDRLLAELAALSGFEAPGARRAADLLTAFDKARLPKGDRRWSPAVLLAAVR